MAHNEEPMPLDLLTAANELAQALQEMGVEREGEPNPGAGLLTNWCRQRARSEGPDPDVHQIPGWPGTHWLTAAADNITKYTTGINSSVSLAEHLQQMQTKLTAIQPQVIALREPIKAIDKAARALAAECKRKKVKVPVFDPPAGYREAGAAVCEATNAAGCVRALLYALACAVEYRRQILERAR